MTANPHTPEALARLHEAVTNHVLERDELYDDLLLAAEREPCLTLPSTVVRRLVEDAMAPLDDHTPFEWASQAADLKAARDAQSAAERRAEVAELALACADARIARLVEQRDRFAGALQPLQEGAALP